MTTTNIAIGCPVDEAFDPLSPAYLAAPDTVMAALPLAEAPVFYAPTIGYYVIGPHARSAVRRVVDPRNERASDVRAEAPKPRRSQPAAW